MKRRALAAALALVMACASCLAALAVTTPAYAQGAGSRPEVKAWLDEDTVAVGDTVDVIFEVMSSGAPPSEPELSIPASFSVQGSNRAPSTSISIVNGVRSDRRGLTTTWRLRAERVGRFRIGPPSIDVGGTRYRAQPLTVNVLEPGRATRKPSRQVPQPFDPFQGLFNFGHGNPFEPQLEPQEPVDNRLALDAPRDATAFLHATVDKTSAVVGEQVTFTVYVYVDASARDPEFTDVHEAPASDFVRRSLREDDSQPKSMGVANVGGHLWAVRLIRKSALFPLKAGELDIGPMSLAIVSGRGTASGTSGVRTSEPLHVRVGEPPVAGRPPGYALGDVGAFQLTAKVDPRAVERGGAVGVTVDLSGTGNLPSSLTPPQRPGVEWLEPQVHEKVGLSTGEDFGGTRSFGFVVRLQQAGEIDLGELTLPYWNPRTRAYATARAALGVVHVAPGGASPTASDAPPDPLPGLPALRTERAAVRVTSRPLTDAPLMWFALGAPTLAYGVFAGVRDGARRARERREKGIASPRAEMKGRLKAVSDAIASGDAGAIDGAVARALEAGAVAYAGVNVRGVGIQEVSARLVAAGVDADAARDLEALLVEIASSRFSAGAGEATSTADATQRFARAKRVLERLERR